MNKKKIESNPILQDDILRYKKNKLAASLALLALVFNCLYFMLFYSVHKNYFYTILLGASVIVNLFVLLLGFFCSEGIKGYNGKFAYVLFGLAAVQIIRIFIFPLRGMSKNVLNGNYYFGVAMKSPLQGTILIVFLVLSAACFIASGVYGLIMARRLVKFQKKIDNGEISVEETLMQVEKAEAQVQTNVATAENNGTQVTENLDAESGSGNVSSEEADNG